MKQLRIGVDLGGTKIEVVALDDVDTELLRRRLATPRGNYAATIERVAELVRWAESSLGCQGSVGVGTPGALCPEMRRIKNANSLCLNDRALLDDLQAALGRSLRLANDADCFALSEARDGAGVGAASVFGVIVGTGTGAGIVVSGRLLTGVNGIAGEWGHNPLPWPDDDERPGPACYCGKHGCIETWLSGPALEREYRELTGATLSAAAIADRERGGDAAAVQVLARYCDRMARSLASVINVLDPACVVLGGGMGNIERLYRDVPGLWDRYVFSDRVRTRLLKPRFGDSSGVRGAARLWDDR